MLRLGEMASFSGKIDPIATAVRLSSPLGRGHARAVTNDMSTLWTPAKAWGQWQGAEENATTALPIQTCPPFAALACLRPQDFQDFRQKSHVFMEVQRGKSSKPRQDPCDSELGFLTAPAANQKSTLPQIWIRPAAGR